IAYTFGLTCIYGVIFSLGLPSNLLSLWGLYHLGRSGGGGCQLVYILNLLLSDLLQLLTLPLWIIYLQGGHRWPYGQLTCELVGYVFYVNVYASVMFLCLIAMDRCLAIVYPLSSRRVRTIRVAAVSGVAVWTLTFLFCLSGLLPSVFDADRLLCLEQYPVSSKFAYFKIATVLLGFLLPSIRHSPTILTLRRSPSLSDHERHKIVGILVVITINFIAVFGPYHLMGGYRFVSLLRTEVPCELEHSIFLVYRLCYGLTSLNTLLDPLFYIFLCPDESNRCCNWKGLLTKNFHRVVVGGHDLHNDEKLVRGPAKKEGHNHSDHNPDETQRAAASPTSQAGVHC
uniref:Si:dkey-165a24.9 n=1 Tax=Oryzias latipes TaxID=8090 RepID=A0A3P9L899_ORYLA